MSIEDLDNWKDYVFFLIEWAVAHKSPQFYGMCPPSYDEWVTNEMEASND